MRDRLRAEDELALGQVANGLDVEGVLQMLGVTLRDAFERIHRRVRQLGEVLTLVRLSRNFEMSAMVPPMVVGPPAAEL